MIELFIKIQIPGWHSWPVAPEKYKELCNLHRHVFHIEVKFNTPSDDRGIEFIDFKNQLMHLIYDRYPKHQQFSQEVVFGDLSCETIAKDIFLLASTKVIPLEVSVSEDNENGATYYVNLFKPSPFSRKIGNGPQKEKTI